MGTQIVKMRNSLEVFKNKKRRLNYLASLLEDPSDIEVVNNELEKFRSEGNEQFKKGQFLNAVDRYSLCLKLGIPFVLAGSVAGLEIRRDILTFAASNRAQALLNVRLWEKALMSSEEALELYPKHAKSLYRKAKALQGLQEYKTACSVLEYALELRPNNVEINDTLKQCKSLYHQSITGEYDLAQILCRGGYAPLFSDFVGPVEVRTTASSGRGLFLTRAVETGELLMVTNAFAFGGSEKKEKLQNFGSLTEELVFTCHSSKKSLHQLHYLRGDDNKDYTAVDKIPPMELFIPGSNWSLEFNSKLEIPTVDEAYGQAKVNSFDAIRSILPMMIGEGKHDMDQLDLTQQMTVTGVWILPSFMNHSCAPNCATQSFGSAMFIRATESMLAGEELTISYVATEDIDREQNLSHWKFKCRCARCLQDDWVRPLIQELLDEAKEQISTVQKAPIPDDTFPNVCRLVARIEDTIKSLSVGLGEKQKMWMHVPFQKIYFHKLRFEGLLNRPEKIHLLKTILGGYDSINMGVGGMNLQLAVSYMHAVEFEYGESSEEYQEARRELELQFTKTLGNLKKEEIEELLRTKFTTDNLWYDMRK